MFPKLPLLLTLLAALPLTAQDTPPAPTEKKPLPPGIAWETDYDAALARARAENRPLMVAFVIKGEKANEQVMKEHFRDAEIIAFSRKFVCLVACQGVTEDTEGRRTDGESGKVSKKLGAASASEIRKIEKRARTELLEANRVSCPQFLFLSPDLETVLLRHVWMLPKGQLLAKMKTAWAFHAPEALDDGMRAAQARVTEALERMNDKDPAIRRAALSSLAAMTDPRIVPALVERTGNGFRQLLRTEAIFFGMAAEDNALVLPRLHSLLADKDVLVRVHATVAIGRIGLVDSVPALEKALKRERQGRVRSHLLRALAACIDEREKLPKVVVPALKARSEPEAVTASYLAAQLDDHEALINPLGKMLGNSNDRIRFAAYVAVGQIGHEKHAKAVARRASREKRLVKEAAMWAWDRLGGPEFEGEMDPEALVYRSLPDNHLWEGRFEPNEDEDGRGRNGRGGRGGRGGGGRGGRR